MSNKKTYYIRTTQTNGIFLEKFCKENLIECIHLSTDIGENGVSILYHVELSREDATALKLKFSFIGFMDLHKTLGGLKNTVHRCDDTTVMLK